MKGILFKPWKTKAIAENPDREWQTRRISGLEEINKEPDKYRLYAAQLADHSSFAFYSGPDNLLKFARPRYLPGETVYIKEAWYHRPDGNVSYKSDYPDSKPCEFDTPMFMPAWAARYFIKILDARPERLQEITFGDARAEGILSFDQDHPDPTNGGVGYNRGAPGLPMRYESTAAYMDLWGSINPKTPWANNDWVWRYVFKLTESK